MICKYILLFIALIMLVASAQALSDYYTLHFQALTNSPVDAVTDYFGNMPKAPNLTSNISKMYIDTNGTIERVMIYDYSGTAGTAESWSYYVRKNNVTDYFVSTLSITNNERVFSNNTINVPVSNGDYIEIKRINPTWVTNPATNIVGGYVLINTTDGYYDAYEVQALTNSPADATTNYFGNIPSAPSTSAVRTNVFFPYSGYIVASEIYDFSGSAGTNQPYAYYIRKNNVVDYLVNNISVATNERIFSNKSLNVSITSGDYIQIKRTHPTWATNPFTNIVGGYLLYNTSLVGYNLEVQALTSSPVDNQIVYFGNLPKAPMTTGSQSKVYIPVSGTIKKAEIYTYSGTAGTAEEWSLYIRKNDATDYLISTLDQSASERNFRSDTLNISVSSGDFIEIKGVQPTWVTNPATTIYGGNIFIDTQSTPTPTPTPVSAQFVGSPMSGNVPINVSFTDLSTGYPTSWNWSFGDGNYSTLQNPSHIYAGSGTFTVSLNATNAYGSNTYMRTGYIVVSAMNGTCTDWLSGWNYRQKVHINGSSSGDLTNYQVNLSVYNISGISSGSAVYIGDKAYDDIYFNDLRVTTSDGTTLCDIWNETSRSNGWDIWAEIPAIDDTLGTDIYVYYGNSGASAVWDGMATFPLLFDHFDGISLNTSKWSNILGFASVSNSILNVSDNCIVQTLSSYGVNYSVRTRGNIGTIGYSNTYFGFVVNSAELAIINVNDSPRHHTFTTTLSSVSTYSGYGSYITGSHIYDIKRNGSTSIISSVDDIIFATHTTNFPISSEIQRYYSNTNDVSNYDWYLVRQYRYPEPIHSTWTSEEIAPVTPDFNGTPVSGSTPLSVQFYDLSTTTVGTITSWTWNFGDGTTSTSQNPAHTYTSSGTYTVTMTVTADTCGSPYTVTKVGYVTAGSITPTSTPTPTPTANITTVSTTPIPTPIPFQGTGIFNISEKHGETWIQWFWRIPDSERGSNNTLWVFVDDELVMNMSLRSNITISETYLLSGLSGNEQHNLKLQEVFIQ